MVIPDLVGLIAVGGFVGTAVFNNSKINEVEKKAEIANKKADDLMAKISEDLSMIREDIGELKGYIAGLKNGKP